MATEKPLKIQVIQLPSRSRHIFPSLPPSTTLAELQTLISEKVSIPPASQSLFNGFPPKEIETDTADKKKRTLIESGIKNGDTVEVRQKEQISNEPEMKQGKGWEYPPTVDKGTMQRKDMPRDNSCLFHAIAYVCNNKATGIAAASHIREVVANLVASDPARYNTIFLGSPNHLYQQHILNTDTWGGAIELSILATHFQCEILAYDHHYLREDIFGQGEGYKRRVFLLYTGDHYDAMVWIPSSSIIQEQVMFSTRDDNAWVGARNYVHSLHTESARRGDCELQKDWRHEQGLKRKDERTAEIERLKRVQQEKEKRKKDEEKELQRIATKGNTISNNQPQNTTSIQNIEEKKDGIIDNTSGWQCTSCTLRNSRSSLTCIACGAPSPFYEQDLMKSSSSSSSSANLSSSSFQSSTTSASTSRQHTSSSPPRGVSPSPSLPSSSSISGSTYVDPKSFSDQFICPTCTYHNKASVPRCEICSEPNPIYVGSTNNPHDIIDDDGVRAPIPHQEDQLIGGPTFPIFPIDARQTRIGSGAHIGAPIAHPAYTSSRSSPTSSSLSSSSGIPPQINEAVLAIEWTCPSCTSFNQPYTTACAACHEPHPLLFGPTPSTQPTPPVGGWNKLFGSEPRWVCESCGVDNLPNLIRCRACKAPNVHLLQRASQQQQQGGGNCIVM